MKSEHLEELRRHAATLRERAEARALEMRTLNPRKPHLRDEHLDALAGIAETLVEHHSGDA